MEKTNRRILCAIIIVAAIAIAMLLVTIGIVFGERNLNMEPWVLQSYGNNVALYNGDEVVEVYGAIMLDTLPDEDKRLFENGITFITKEEAIMAIEDFDG